MTLDHVIYERIKMEFLCEDARRMAEEFWGQEISDELAMKLALKFEKRKDMNIPDFETWENVLDRFANEKD